MVAVIKHKAVQKSGLAPSDCDEPSTTLPQTTYYQYISQRLDLFLLRTYWLHFSNTPNQIVSLPLVLLIHQPLCRFLKKYFEINSLY